MTNFGRKLYRKRLKEQFKQLKKEHKDLKNMSFAQFKEYYEQIVSRTKPNQAEQIVEAEEQLDDIFVDDIEEENDKEDSVTE